MTKKYGQSFSSVQKTPRLSVKGRFLVKADRPSSASGGRGEGVTHD
jgi:hypothetical protein